MTRILYWNISNFSRNKIANPLWYRQAESADRLVHIVNEVFAQQVPDIFVVVEVYYRRAYWMLEGLPVSDASRAGVIGLLDAIRAVTNNNWMVVPALWSGTAGFCEGVAVFYNQTVVQFAGPYVFGPDYRTAGAHSPPIVRGCPRPQTVRPGWAPGAWPNGPRLYPLSWQQPPGGGGSCLPARATPAGVNAMVNEDRLAGQYEFFDAFGNRIYFPGQMQRSPFLTCFDVLGAAKRLKIFAVHTSPLFAAQALAQLQHIQELPPAANEVSIVVGDFNVDTFANRAAYNGLTGMGFQLHFDSMQAGMAQPTRLPYCLTHYLPENHATPFGTLGGAVASPIHDVYPRFGYMGSMGGAHFTVPATSGAIDNVLTQYDGGLVAPAHNKTIVNKVVGTPYAAAGPMPPPAIADLTVGQAYASSLANPIPSPNGRNSTIPAPPDYQTQFRQWGNFGRIRSTSDHLALLIDV
jgi:hypothetical protein